MGRDVEKRIVRLIEAALLRAGVRRGAGILVGLSGGGDSVALTYALIDLRERLGLKVIAAHLNHQLRGTDSDRDEEFVRAMCARLGIELIAERADELGSSQSKANLEERARDARREFLNRAADRIGADFIGLGHNRDDQAETVLMRLIRGAGAAGMAAMAERGPGRLLRPMLSISRAELRDYLNTRAIAFVEDLTNESRDVLRNRIRHDLMPTLERDYAPGVAGRLVALADEMRAVDELVAAAAATELVAMRERGAHGAALNIARFSSLNRALQGGVIRQFLAEHLGTLRKISRSHIDALRELVLEGQPSDSVDLPSGWRAHRQYNLLEMIPAASARDTGTGFEVAIALDGVTIVEPARFKFDASTVAAAKTAMPDSLLVAMFDAAEINGDLVARNFMPGDRINPIGMRGTRKVHDVFVDRKLPRARRSRFPMVMIEGRIAWIPGLARADCAIVTKATETILRVEASEIGPL